jgi:protein SCO1/2
MTLLVLALLACGTPTEAPPAAAPTDPAAEAPAASGAASAAVPTDSLYQLHPTLTDQHGATVGLDVHRGHPVIVTMFYATCPEACPRLIGDLKALEAGLTDAERADLRVLLVSLDPEQDTAERLAEAVREHEVDDARWTLSRTDPDHVREVAAALGIRYRPTGDGEMNHSSLLTLLDRDGRPVAKLEGLDRDPAPLVEALRKLGR